MTPAQQLLEVALGTLFLVAGASKLLSPHPFGRALQIVLRSKRALTAWSVAARLVGVAEIATAVAICTVPGFGGPAGAALGIGIVVFSVVALLGHRSVACGCFGRSEGSSLGVQNLLAGVGIVVGAIALTAIQQYGHVSRDYSLERLAAISLLALLYVIARDASTLLQISKRLRSA